MKYRICKTSGCIKAAQYLSKYIDTTVDPCENFYQFACGKYIKEDTNSIAVYDRGLFRIRDQLKASIEDKIVDSDPRTLKLLKSHYNSCLDTEKIERSSAKILLDILNRLGGWPVLVGGTWDESRFDWKNVIYQLRRIGYGESIDCLMKLKVDFDEKNNTKYVVQLDQAETKLEHEYLVNSKNEVYQRAYYKYMVDITELLGVNRQRAKRELLGSVLFEMKLAQISVPEEERKNMSQLYNPMTVEELQSKYPGIPWKEYINEFLRPYYVIESSERIIVRNPNYLKSLIDLLSKTPKRDLANYIFWRVVEESTLYLNRQARIARSEFMAIVKGTGEYSRWEECIDYLTENLPLAVGALYLRKVFDVTLKKEGEKLVKDLRKSFKNSLEKIDWMDEKTREKALKKLNLIYAHVAYPNELLDDNKLDDYFKILKEYPDSYLDGYLSVSLFYLDDEFKSLRKPYNKTYWVTYGNVAVDNAFYHDFENSIEIPAGFFQQEFFAIDKPNYMNYAGLGFYVGHELTHAFGDAGSQYDGEGNLVSWWNPKTYKEYQKRVQCIVNQYSNYTITDVDMKINGINTQGENIADNGGVKQAYYAYEEFEKRNGPEPRLPGFHYSPRQLFWISNANVHCENQNREFLKYFIMTDEHSPGKFRVIGSFSNTPEFAKDFKCPLGSPMNPVKKCMVW